ncbi:MAG: hypothetical protein A2268_15120 [Candidatus Raymondbacteria bacterium RifOxyA12_full_50_37]|nr:MAG: hypothetical protein A2268_15120 [Candidatus Raymondbacteria bacterium RifOxyA12_full_50_37]OGJ88511.1 MAG: hypothetical protein A2248_20140 [Candidatus Raymondbacteria bacterium RIFOXYA2_FULL_49_16]OGJ90606.1 MAG: hypothetical protein A2350_18370 [Candidatus Raymondbacteria bacterium RifOxyB12_full_50_8]OGJ98972.1 MAG: hypothetical protein A2453_10860 [Candidatus Raymondbacteria bacterium RIFOXYC2_FULL_50_21]OGK00610.1 MAG: hypothetical protein A2487_13705 [Candidatus Raymondbacteria b
MIPKDYITEWRRTAPWTHDAQVEQDLVISRALGEMFGNSIIREHLVFRGGTALYKLYSPRQVRYSEDIDLVQAKPGAIGKIVDELRSLLDPWLGQPRRVFVEDSVKLVYRFQSEDIPSIPLRLKIEINTREHGSLYGTATRPLNIVSRYYSVKTEIPTYQLEELLGTKMRALYQRKKGRDLFDMWYFFKNTDAESRKIVECFQWYTAREGKTPSRANFESNLHDKSKDHSFGREVEPFLAQGVMWDPHGAMRTIHDKLVSKLTGEPWKGNARLEKKSKEKIYHGSANNNQ